MKALKYEHQSIFLLWGRLKLNFRDRYTKPNIVFNNSSCYQFFSSNSQKLSLWCKRKNHFLPIWICMTHIWFPILFPRGIMTFPGVLTKFNFLTKFPRLQKIVDFMKYLKYKPQSIFSLWGRVKLNFRDRYEKPNIYSKNSSCCQVVFTGLSKNDFGIILQTLTHP